MGSPPAQGPEDYFAPGDWNIICSICGTKLKFSKAVQNWQGQWRHVHCNEPRPAQDFVHSINSQEMAIPVPQKMGDIDIIFCDLNGVSAIPGLSIPGCMLPGANAYGPGGAVGSNPFTYSDGGVNNNTSPGSLLAPQSLSWTAVASPVAGQTISGMAADNLGNILFVSLDGKVYRSTDGGGTWALRGDTGLPTFFGSLRYRNGTWIYAGGSTQIARSTDLGLTWAIITVSPSFFAAGANALTVSTFNPIWLIWSNVGSVSNNYAFSHNDGLTWTLPNSFLNDGMSYDHLGFSPLDSRFLISFPSGALYSTLGEISNPAFKLEGFLQEGNGCILTTVAGSGGAPVVYAVNQEFVQSGAGVVNLLASPQVDITIENNVTAFVGSSLVSFAFSQEGAVSNSFYPSIAGSWVPGNLRFASPTEAATCAVFDVVHQYFVAGGNNGSISRLQHA